MNKLIITPDTKIAALLKAYPDLEDELIAMAPAFKKLKNPVLRRTITRVTSLKQAAAVGNMPLDKLINHLREKAGQDKLQDLVEDPKADPQRKPLWFDKEKIKGCFDAREMIAVGGHPLQKVLKDAKDLAKGEIYELVAPFLPAPLIDKMKEQGFESYTEQEGDGLWRVWFCKV